MNKLFIYLFYLFFILILNILIKTYKGKELDGIKSEGILCIKKPWPSMARTIYGDHKRFIETYLKKFPGYINIYFVILLITYLKKKVY